MAPSVANPTIFIDVETTALEPGRSSCGRYYGQVAWLAWQVVDVAEAVRAERKGLPWSLAGEYGEVRVRFDEQRADPKSLAVWGYQSRDWRHAVPTAKAVQEFSEVIRRASSGVGGQRAFLGGHNIISFDVPFMRKSGWGSALALTSHACVDTMHVAASKVATRRIPWSGFSLAAVAQGLGVSFPGDAYPWHHPGYEAVVSARVAVALEAL